MTATRAGTGLYLVDFGGSVVGKPLSATFNFPFFGFIDAAPCGGTANNPGGVNCPLFNDSNHVEVQDAQQHPGLGGRHLLYIDRRLTGSRWRDGHDDVAGSQSSGPAAARA